LDIVEIVDIFDDGRSFIASNLPLATKLLFLIPTFLRGGSQTMPPDANAVRELMKRNLLGVFSEHDAEKRRSLIAEIWDSKCIFIDPEGRYVGHTGVNDAVEKLQRRSPDFEFSVLADGDVNSGVGRLPWGFGPPGEPRKITGIDVLVASDDGRITALYTFADAVKG